MANYLCIGFVPGGNFFRMNCVVKATDFNSSIRSSQDKQIGIRTTRGSGAIKRGVVQLKGAWFPLQAPGSPYRAIASPCGPSPLQALFIGDFFRGGGGTTEGVDSTPP